MFRKLESLPRLVLLGFGLMLVAGCSGGGGVRYPETGATLEGTVTYGKDRIVAALVIAQNASGSATGFVGDDGKYRLQNVPLGEVNIAVNTEAGKGEAMGRIMSQSAGKAKGGGGIRLIDVPNRYHDPATSGIKTTINKGPNTFDIVIPR